MTSRIRRVGAATGLLLTLAASALAAPPAIAQAGALAQDGCGAGFCGVVPAAWDNPYTYGSFADAVNFTKYANVTNYVAYRNTVSQLVWAAGQ